MLIFKLKIAGWTGQNSWSRIRYTLPLLKLATYIFHNETQTADSQGCILKPALHDLFFHLQSCFLRPQLRLTRATLSLCAADQTASGAADVFIQPVRTSLLKQIGRDTAYMLLHTLLCAEQLLCRSTPMCCMSIIHCILPGSVSPFG